MERPTRIPESPRAMPDNPAIPLRKVESTHSLDSVAPARVMTEREAIESGDTLAYRSPVMKLTAEQRERERILPPNAAGHLGDSYKMLRTQVLRRLDQLHANSIAVLSPTAGAGKTLTAINLAIAIAAEAGRTALLIDFDLRNPCIAKRLGLRPKIGLEECLQSCRPIQDAMIKLEGYERLTVLPARERVAQSSELLSDKRCAELISEMRTRYANRVLIFDLPPVLQTDDALVVSRQLQAGLIVVGEGKTKRDDVTRSIELLHDLTMVGTVLNASRSVERMPY